jgi:Fe2+ transport system protein B
MMSCEARIPIYIMIVGTFFALKYQWLVMLSLYAIGILMAVFMSKLFTSFVVKGEDTPFVMELPPYRFPTFKALTRHTWEKGRQYLKKWVALSLWQASSFGLWGIFHTTIISPRSNTQSKATSDALARLSNRCLHQGFQLETRCGTHLPA